MYDPNRAEAEAIYREDVAESIGELDEPTFDTFREAAYYMRRHPGTEIKVRDGEFVAVTAWWA